MYNKGNHIIRTLDIDVSFLQKNIDTNLQNKLAEIVHQKLMPACEALFDEKVPAEKLLKIEVLEIEPPVIYSADWPDLLVEATIKKIREKLDAIGSFSAPAEVYEISYPADTVAASPTLQNELLLLLHFISYGVMPWQLLPSKIDEWFKDLAKLLIKESSSKFLEQLTHVVFSSPATFSRFVAQVPRTLREAVFSSTDIKHTTALVLSLVPPGYPAAREKLLRYIILFANSSAALQAQQVSAILQSLFTPGELLSFLNNSHDRENEEALPSALPVSFRSALYEASKNLPEESTSKDRQTVKSRPSSLMEKAGEEFFIENAGLVILHPFLTSLFAHLDYTRHNAFNSVEHHQRAVLYSQYLVTGQTTLPEYELLLNKLLCGYTATETLPPYIELTSPELSEAKDLLESVIRHWSALKNTGINGLRGTFLQRAGKLTLKDDHWLLQVEQKPFDVLMNYLPWGIGIIKLPWMEQRMLVEWS